MDKIWVLIVTLTDTREFLYCTLYETKEAAEEAVKLESCKTWTYVIRKKGVWS